MPPSLFRLALLCSPALAAPIPAQQPAAPAPEPARAVWHTDADAALALAGEQRKSLLFCFYASDGEPQNRLLWEEVLNDPLVDRLAEHYVLVALDFPRDPGRAEAIPEAARNRELRLEYAVVFLPMVVIARSDGSEVCWTDYRPGGAQPFFHHVNGLLEAARRTHALTERLQARIESGERVEDAIAEAARALSGVPQGVSQSGDLEEIVRTGLEREPQDVPHLHIECLRALARQHLLWPREHALARELDPENRHGLLELIVCGEGDTAFEDEELIAFVDAMLALRALGPTRDADRVFPYARDAAFEAARRGRADDADALMNWALELGEVPADEGDAFVAARDLAREIRERLPELERALSSEEPGAREAAVREGAALFARMIDGVQGADALYEVVAAGYALDPDNQTGLQLVCLQAIAAAGWLYPPEDAERVYRLDPANRHGVLEALLAALDAEVHDFKTATAQVEAVLRLRREGVVHDRERVGRLALSAAFLAARLERTTDARALITWADELIAVDDASSQALADILDE